MELATDRNARAVGVGSRDEDVLVRARLRWPDFEVSSELFASFLASRLAIAVDARAEDLYLACACALGDPRAIAAFERLYFDEVDGVASRLRNKGLRADDVRQQVRERLFLATAEGPPKIATYSGEGDLRHWVRVVSMRVVLNMTRGPERERADEAVLLRLPDIADDPELGFMKRLYREQFDEAVAEAFSTLPCRERNLLRYAAVDGLTSLAIGSIYGVHRTTVKRWLGDAETALLGSIRTSMMRRLRVDRKELDSILRLVQSRLDLRLGDRDRDQPAISPKN